MSGSRNGVFVSYVQSDGSEIAAALRRDLEANGLTVWQDVVRMEGGRDWWLQITEALDHVEYMVVVITPDALRSDVIRKVWLTGRQNGVGVLTVLGWEKIDFGTLPRWMRGVHFYQLPAEFDRLLNYLKTPCTLPRVPSMAEAKLKEFVPRPQEFEELISKLIDSERHEPLTITTALCGAGGVGKTTLALALCHDERIQKAFHDGILWVTLGKDLSSPISHLNSLIQLLSGEAAGFVNVNRAKWHFARLLDDRNILLVVDDVWKREHLTPFLYGGSHCTKLVTTSSDTLPPNTARVEVNSMRLDEAVELLGYGLSPEAQPYLHALAACLGEWPLLLRLVNSALRFCVNDCGESIPDAIEHAHLLLNCRGLTAFSLKDSNARIDAVEKTIGVSLALLGPEEVERFKELAIFPENIDIPVAVIERLWSKTGGLDELDVDKICERLDRLSLFQNRDLKTKTIRLHGVIRAYLGSQLGKGSASVQEVFLESMAPVDRSWSNMAPPDARRPENRYIWIYLGEHLLGANRAAELHTTLRNPHYIAAKTFYVGAASVEQELRLACGHLSNNDETDASQLSLLLRQYAQFGHLFSQVVTPEEVRGILRTRLHYLPALKSFVSELKPGSGTPWISSSATLPDQPHPRLIRTLTGNSIWLRSGIISRDESFIVSASYDKTLKVLDAQSGVERFTLAGHTDWVTECAISCDGSFIVSASDDKTLKVWDAQSGMERFTLVGHTDKVTVCAISRDGSFIISASWDKTVKMWDAQSGAERFTLAGYTEGVHACEISRDGSFIVLASEYGTLKVWDVHRGVKRFTLGGHSSSINAYKISRDGSFIVSASDDKTLKVWDAQSGIERFHLTGHTDSVNACAISRDGSFIVSASADNTLKVWDAQSGTERFTLAGHTDSVSACAISRDGSFIVSASHDHTLKVWDAQSGAERFTLTGHSGWVTSCKVSRDGSVIFSAAEDDMLKVWDAQSTMERFTPAGYAILVNACAISHDGSFIVSGSEDHTLKVWDAQSGRERFSLSVYIDDINASCAISRDGSFIVSASHYNTLKVWDAQSGRERFTLEGHTDWVTECAISRDGSFIVSAACDNTLKVWDAQSGRERFTLAGHSDMLITCAISRDGSFIVSASADNTLKVWDVESGMERFTLRGHTGTVSACAISRDESFIVSASWDNTLKVWDAQSGMERFTLTGHTDTVSACAISRDGSFIVSASADNRLKVWDVQSGVERFTLSGHTNYVYTCEISCDGNFIISASVDGTLRVWSLHSRACAATFVADGCLSSCAWYPDGRHIVTAGSQGVYFLEFHPG